MNPTRKNLRSKQAAIATTSLCVALSFPIHAQAEQVTLKSTTDSSLLLTGEFVSFENDVYMLDTIFGLVKVQNKDNIICIGDGCPVEEPEIITGPIVWDVSLWGSRRAFTEHVEKLAELVDAKTGGQLTLNISYGGLAPSSENLDGIASGKFEMAQFCSGYHPDKNPSITILELPFLGVGSLEEEVKVSQAVYGHPAVIADMARWNATLLMPTPQPQYNIVGVGSPPISLASFKTMTIRATGGTADAIDALGGTSVNLPAPQVNEALTKGEINAVAFAPHAHMAFNTVENAVWWTTNLNPGTANCPVVVNSDALKSLPPASRVALFSSVDESLDHFIDNYTNNTIAAWNGVLADRQIIELQFSDEILNAISEEVTGPAADAWIAEKTDLGLPAKELYELVKETLNSSS